jgi:hypothetical protein
VLVDELLHGSGSLSERLATIGHSLKSPIESGVLRKVAVKIADTTDQGVKKNILALERSLRRDRLHRHGPDWTQFAACLRRGVHQRLGGITGLE